MADPAKYSRLLVFAVVAAVIGSLLAALPAAADQSEGKPGVARVAAARISAGLDHTCAVLEGGAVRCWGGGESSHGQLGYGNSNVIGDNETPSTAGPVNLGAGRSSVAIAAGGGFACALLDNGTVRCWGEGAFGQLGYGNPNDVGDNETPNTVGPVDLGAGRTAVAITAGQAHTCAVLDNGTVRCWGFGGFGALGYGSSANIGDDEAPGSKGAVDLGAGRTAVAISAGGAHTCVVLDNGTVRCWGEGGSGQLGYGNAADVGTGLTGTPGSVGPVDLGAGRTAVAISAGGAHTCAVLDNGTVRCWGSANEGKLGYGNTDNVGDNETPGSKGPVDLGAGRTAVAISAGNAHTCAGLDSGTVRCWGSGEYGQLGYGNVNDVGDDETPGSVGPVDLGAGRTAVAISNGQHHTCAVLDNGTLRCWGQGEYGQIGYGNTDAIGDNETPDTVGPVNLGGSPHPPTAPSSPTIGTAFAGDTQALVEWSAPGFNGASAITGYVVTPFIGSTAQAPVSVGAVTSSMITGLTNGTAYTFKVAAKNAIGTGAQSAASNTVTPAAVPGPPTSVSATAGNAQATVTWSAPTSNGGSAVSGYVVTSFIGSTAQTSTHVSAVTSTTIAGLTNGQTYTFKVAAKNARGTGTLSAASNAVLPQPAASTATAPGAPNIIVADDSRVVLVWDPPSSFGNGTFTRWEVVNVASGAVVATENHQGTTAAQVTGLTNGTAYTFKVRAVTSHGVGALSPTSNSVTPQAPATAPGAPTNVTATAGNAQVSVSWTAPASNGGSAITGYTVTASPGGATKTVSGSTTSTVFTGLTNGTAYRFTVRAANGVGSGPASAASNSVTPAAPDTTKPTTRLTSPVAWAQLGSAASVRWTGADSGGSGIKQFTLARKRAPYNANFGSVTYTTLPASTLSTSATLTAGSTDCFTIRAIDKANNVGAFSPWRCTTLPLDDRALSRSAGWTQGSSSSYFNSTYTAASTVNRTLAKARAQMMRIGLVAVKCKRCGTVAVKVGPTTIGTVNLYSSTTKYKQFISLPAFSLRTGTVSVVTTSSGKAVYIDGLALSRQ